MEVSIEQRLKYFASSLIVHSEYIRMAEIEDPIQKSAFKVVLNMLDILIGQSIPEIENYTLEASKKIGLLHLMYNNKMTPAQREVFEGWVFDNNKF